MIIKIECDSEIKHLSIDFGEAGVQTTTLINNDGAKVQTKETPNYRKEEALDLDADFDQEVEEVVAKPVIEEIEREVLVSKDMLEATY